MLPKNKTIELKKRLKKKKTVLLDQNQILYIYLNNKKEDKKREERITKGKERRHVKSKICAIKNEMAQKNRKIVKQKG